ncbi:MAG: group 1 truncated hemoglobin [Magnetospirillum sp.]
MNQSLFDRLGGEAAITAAVDLFYQKVLADSRINQFFANVDMRSQALKQRAFMTLAFGGPGNYSGKHMRAAHAGLTLTDIHFDAVAEHLGATLNELGVPAAMVGEVLATVETTRADVLNR